MEGEYNRSSAQVCEMPNGGLWIATRSFGLGELDLVSGANHILPLAAAPMPVELLSFEAEKTSTRQVLLQWKTEETEAAFFQIERKGSGNWEKVSEKIEVVNTHSYQFLDQNAPEDVLYYRLIMTDDAGKAAYSPLRSVDLRTAAHWLIYPNPVSDILHIQSENTDESPFLLTLMTVDGRVAYSAPITFEHSKTATFSLSGLLPSGWYQLLLADTEGRAVTRKGVVVSPQ